MQPSLSTKQQYWKDHIEQALSEKTSLTGYAKRHNLDPQALYNYKSLLQKKGVLPQSAGAFAKVCISPQPGATRSSPVRARLPNGVILELPSVTTDVLASLMAL